MRLYPFSAAACCAVVVLAASLHAQEPGRPYVPPSHSSYSPSNSAPLSGYSTRYQQNSSGFAPNSASYQQGAHASPQDSQAYPQKVQPVSAESEWTPGQILPPEPVNATGADDLNMDYEMRSVDEVVDPPTYPNVRMSGFFQLDTAWFGQSASNRAALGDIQDGTDFRRARLQALGDIYENIGFSLEFDFAFPGHPSFMDVWLEARQLVGNSNLRMGQYRQPIMMAGLTSVKELTFLERALPFALIPFRQVGAMLHGTTAGDDGTYAVGLFRFPTDFYGGQVGDTGGYGFIGRLTSVAIDEGDDMLVHVGGAYSFIDPANDAVRYLTQPEFSVSQTGGALTPIGVPSSVPPFIDTGVIPTNSANLFGAEFAARMNQLHIQSEFLASVVNRIGSGTAFFPGAYLQAGYMLTGEARPYVRNQGILGRIRPFSPVDGKGGIGAWEVAARWSWLDLNSGNIRGGSLNDLTFGVNWWLNYNTKFQFNYIHAFLQNPMTNIHSSADVVAMRAQVDF